MKHFLGSALGAALGTAFVGFAVFFSVGTLFTPVVAYNDGFIIPFVVGLGIFFVFLFRHFNRHGGE